MFLKWHVFAACHLRNKAYDCEIMLEFHMNISAERRALPPGRQDIGWCETMVLIPVGSGDLLAVLLSG